MFRKGQENLEEVACKDLDWHPTRGEKNHTADSTIHSLQPYPLLPNLKSQQRLTTESQWPKSCHFRVSKATGTDVMTRRQAVCQFHPGAEAGCVALCWGGRANIPACTAGCGRAEVAGSGLKGLAVVLGRVALKQGERCFGGR